MTKDRRRKRNRDDTQSFNLKKGMIVFGKDQIHTMIEKFHIDSKEKNDHRI